MMKYKVDYEVLWVNTVYSLSVQHFEKIADRTQAGDDQVRKL